MRGRGGHAWRELVRVLCPPGSYCEVEDCYGPSRVILFGLRRGHPLGPSLDHKVELWEGGDPEDPANLRPAHLTCNVRKSNARRAEWRAQQTRARHSRARLAAADEQPRRRRSSSVFDDA